jgi:uracil-DNA glycosylase family 4
MARAQSPDRARTVASAAGARENGGMDALAALALQIEWGADEALADRPLDRRVSQAPQTASWASAVPQTASPTPAARMIAPAPVTPLARAQALAAAAADLQALRAALTGFDGCALHTTATNLVFAEGDPAAPVTLVADVPGAAEDRAGTPFAGPAGAFLDRMLASIGLDRSGVYMCSLLPWRPPGDRKPAEAEIQLCLPFLWRHLALVRPRRVLLLGTLAARALLLSTPGRRPRGVWHPLVIPGLPDAVPTLVLGSPTAIQTTPLAKRDAWADLLRLRRALDENTTIG